MQIRAFIVLAAVIAAPYRLMAAEVPKPGALEECGAYSQAGMRECLAKKSRESAFALKQAESKAVAAIAKWDEDAKYVALAKEKLKASDAAFERYREAQCALAASLGGGAIGNALEIRRLACVTDLNRLRAESVSAAATALPSR
jgi:hypothetical protein